MADFSFYPQGNQNSLLDTVGQAAQIKNLGAQNQLLGIDVQQRHLDLVNNQVNALVNATSSLASDPDLSFGKVQAQTERLVKEGIISPDIATTELQSMQGMAPEQLRKALTIYGLRALDAGQRFNEQYGTPGYIDTGSFIQPVTNSSLTGVHPNGPPVPKTLTPGEKASPAVIGVNGQNQPITGTVSQRNQLLGIDAAGNPTGAPGSLGTPANPLTGQSAAEGGAGPALPTTPVAPGVSGIVTAPAPGAAEAQQAVGDVSGKAYAGDLVNARNYAQNVNPLEQAIPALESLGTTGTGPGTEQVNEIKSFLQSMGFGGDVQNIKNFDEAKKYLTQFVNQTGNTGTNDKLAASFAGNPSVGISNAAAIDVAKTALSLARLQNAQVRAFEQTGQQPADYLTWAANWNKAQDPRAYGFDLMKPEQRARLIDSLKGSDKAKFVASLRNAIHLGLVEPPSAANGQ